MKIIQSYLDNGFTGNVFTDLRLSLLSSYKNQPRYQIFLTAHLVVALQSIVELVDFTIGLDERITLNGSLYKPDIAIMYNIMGQKPLMVAVVEIDEDHHRSRCIETEVVRDNTFLANNIVTIRFPIKTVKLVETSLEYMLERACAFRELVTSSMKALKRQLEHSIYYLRAQLDPGILDLVMSPERLSQRKLSLDQAGKITELFHHICNSVVHMNYNSSNHKLQENQTIEALVEHTKTLSLNLYHERLKQDTSSLPKGTRRKYNYKLKRLTYVRRNRL